MIYRRDSAIHRALKMFFLTGLLMFFGIQAVKGGTVAAGSDNPSGFKPMLLKVEVSANVGVPGDEIIITAWWQNTGSVVAEQRYHCFIEMELGHQRTTEITEKVNRFIWDPMPGTSQWKPGDIHAVSYRMNLPPMWGGTYKIYLGFYDDDHVPLAVAGKNLKSENRINIGEIDLGWGWGVALIKLIKKPWVVEFNKPAEIISPVKNPVILNLGEDLIAGFDASVPGIVNIKEQENIYTVSSLQPEIEFRDYKNDKILYSFSRDVKVNYRMNKTGADSLVYKAKVMYHNKMVASFNLNYKVTGRTFRITLGSKWEAADFELLEIKMLSLFSLSGKDAFMVNFMGGGRLISLDAAIAQGYESRYDTRNAAALYNSRFLAVMESTCLDDKIYAMINQTGSEKSFVIGASIATRVPGKNKIRSIEVPNVHKIEINFHGKECGEPSWMNIARFLRKDLRGRNRDLYKKSIFSLDYITQGPAPEPWQDTEDAPYAVKRLNKGIKFSQVLELIKGYNSLLDGYKQIPQMYGWFKIQDDDKSIIGWPAAGYDADPRGGTKEELKYILRESRKYNAYLQFYENYDDFFYSKYNDSSIVALDAEGNPWKGWFWADGLSYIIGPYKYVASGKLKEHVKKMVETYNMQTNTHMDVLSSEVLRWDFDPEYPASAQKSYWGKLDIIREYNKYNIEVSSETLVHPFVGYLGYALWTRMNPGEIYFSGEKFIPLVTAVYHGTLQFNCSGDNKKDILQGFVLGGNFGFELDKEDYGPVKWCYLQSLPMGELYDEKMEDYTESEGIVNIKYTGDSYIRVDRKNQKYEIAYNGRVIGKDWTTFVPGVKPDSYLAYSLDGGEMSYAVPEGWKERSELRAVQLTIKGEGGEIPVKVSENKIVITMPASVPVRVSMAKK